MAIIVFTLLTKIILLPVSLWMQRNSIRMVALTPDLNRLKIRYFGDKDTIAEETQKLYKEKKYHQFLSMLPMVIQLIMLMGVIAAVKHVLGDSDSVLLQIPVQYGGLTLLMPVAAGLSALLLGLNQNRFNPLQREQGKAEQWMTNGLSIAISLVLGFFVSVGVCIYWIASNLFTIVQQQLLNAIINPRKYVDYEDLQRSKEELKKMNSLSANVSKEDKKREKADYKRFFSVANKHLVFYSESSGFYKYYRGLIEALLKRSNIIIHYVTSDSKDQIFKVAETEPRIRPYYIGEKKLITLFMKMDADIVIMTMPDLESFHIKRSYVRKDIEYVYLFHALASTHMIYRKGAFDHFDTILCAGPHHVRELRESEAMYGLKEKNLVEFGYPLLDDLIQMHGQKDVKKDKPMILIAPSHHTGNIMDSCLEGILAELQSKDWRIVVRPHPQYVRRNPGRMDELKRQYADKENIVFETDFSTNESLYVSDVLITDWSGTAMEYSFVTHHPCIFLNTPKKVLNPEYEKNQSTPALIEVRNQIGISLEPGDVTGIANSIEDMLAGKLLTSDEVAAITEQYVYNLGCSGQKGAGYIIGALKKKKSSKVTN